MKLSGHCLCGDVGFRLEGWVAPIQACHAERCRRATGALFSPEIAACNSRFEWIGDEDRIATYEAPILRKAPPYRRCFCNRCGSPLPLEMPEARMVILCAGILDDASGLYVFRHAFTAQKSAACEITDGAPCFDGAPPLPNLSVLLP